MHNVEKYYLEISNNPDLKKVINKFSDFLILKKEIIIRNEDFLEAQILIESNIIKNENNFLKIKNHCFIAIEILENFKTIFSFNHSIDFNETIVFFNCIKKDFIKSKYSIDYQIIEIEILKILIYESNKKFNLNFNDFITNLSKKNDVFVRAYSENLAFINIDVETIYCNSLFLLEFVKGDKNYNYCQYHIANGIKHKCFIDENTGLALFQLALKKDNTQNNSIIISAIISGLYENIGYSFYDKHLKSLIYNNKKLPETINGLSNINKIEEQEFNLFIKLFNSFKSQADLAFPLSKLLFAILKSIKFMKEYPEACKCFDYLNELLYDEKSLLFILQEIVLLDNNDIKRAEVLENIIKQAHFPLDSQMYNVVHFFWKSPNITYLRQILIAFSHAHPFKNIGTHFNSELDKFDIIEFDNMLLDFLTDNNAGLRFIGMDFFENLPYNKFNVDITELEPIKQYKLWVSLCQTYKEPKYIIPFLIPLLESSSSIVKESFISKLKEYSENYGSHLTEVLEKNLDTNDANHQQILKSIIEYRNDFYETNINIKRNIKELNPYYTNNKILNDFNNFFNKKMRRGINKETDANSFLAFATTIQLAKGGGWKRGENNEIMKLAKIETSMALPRNYFIDPNQYELAESQEQRIDWKEEDFNIIQKWIANEQ